MVSNRKEVKKMLVELIIPIDRLRGQLKKDGYYFRMYRGQQIVQRCPDRSGHVKTAHGEEERGKGETLRGCVKNR